MIKPILTEKTCYKIQEEYAKLRSIEAVETDARTLPVTARTVEALIRLSTSHEKARFSRFVEKKDIETAIEIYQFSRRCMQHEGIHQ